MGIEVPSLATGVVASGMGSPREGLIANQTVALFNVTSEFENSRHEIHGQSVVRQTLRRTGSKSGSQYSEDLDPF